MLNTEKDLMYWEKKIKQEKQGSSLYGNVLVTFFNSNDKN